MAGFKTYNGKHKVTVFAQNKVGEKLTENQKLILNYINIDNNISAKELAGKVGISSRKIEENIKKLKALGLLTRIGPAKGGYWKTL